MTVVRKTDNPGYKTVDADAVEVKDEHAHELGGTLGMAIGGVAAGIAAGAAAGAAMGAAAGPIGVVAGAAIGGALGGSAGESIAREINPTAEEEYWEKNYHTRPYVTKDYSYDTYRPAYRAGIDSYRSNPEQTFDNLEPTLRNNWNISRGNSTLEWEQARPAAQDAYSRLASRKQA